MFKSVSRPPKYNNTPSSPTLTAASTTQTSDLYSGTTEPQLIITRHHLNQSVDAYSNLLKTSSNFRNALNEMNSASANFADALEKASRVKGNNHAETLLTASGIHYLIANQNQILSNTLERSFEIPLAAAHKSYTEIITIRQKEYEDLLAIRTTAIRQTEAANFKAGKQRTRDLNSFRRALEKLQEQVKEVEAVKRAHYQEVLEGERGVWSHCAAQVALLLRSTLDLADRLASKATSDPIVEEILVAHPDPFDAYRSESEEERDVFTVLPPLGNGMNFGRKKIPVVIEEAFGEEVEVSPVKLRPALTPRKTSSNNGSIKPLSVSEALGFSAVPALSPSIVPYDLSSIPLSASIMTPATTTTSSPASSSSPVLHCSITPPPHTHAHAHAHAIEDSDPSPSSPLMDADQEYDDNDTRALSHAYDQQRRKSSIPILKERQPTPVLAGEDDMDHMTGDWSNLRARANEYGQLVDEDD